MKIKDAVIEKINNPKSRTRIAMHLNCGESAVIAQLKLNKIDGRLTKMDALKAISEETGTAIEEILEEVEINVEQK